MKMAEFSVPEQFNLCFLSCLWHSARALLAMVKAKSTLNSIFSHDYKLFN